MNNPCRTAVDYRTSDASKWAGFYDTNDPTIWEYFDENSRIEIGSYGGIAGGNIGWCPSVFGAYEAVGAPKVFIVLIENISGSALTPVDDYLEVKYGIDSESGWPEIVMKGDWSAHYGGWRFYYTTGLENESDSELKLKLCDLRFPWAPCSSPLSYGYIVARVRAAPCPTRDFSAVQNDFASRSTIDLSVWTASSTSINLPGIDAGDCEYTLSVGVYDAESAYHHPDNFGISITQAVFAP